MKRERRGGFPRCPFSRPTRRSACARAGGVESVINRLSAALKIRASFALASTVRRLPPAGSGPTA
jgi:hypothetical protein